MKPSNANAIYWMPGCYRGTLLISGIQCNSYESSGGHFLWKFLMKFRMNRNSDEISGEISLEYSVEISSEFQGRVTVLGVAILCGNF